VEQAGRCWSGEVSARAHAVKYRYRCFSFRRTQGLRQPVNLVVLFRGHSRVISCGSRSHGGIGLCGILWAQWRPGYGTKVLRRR